MQRVLPSTLEAVLLYDALPRYEPRSLLALINEFSAQFGFSFNWLPSEDMLNVLQFSDDTLGIEILHNDNPLPADGFEQSLNSGYTKSEFPDASSAIDNHQQNVYITVGVLDQNGAGVESEGFDDAQFRFAVALLKALTMIYMSKSLPAAIHWLQSDKLFTCRQFAEAALDEKDISLLVHPNFSWSGESGENNEPMVGFDSIGAKTLIGREIRFVEAPVEPDYLYQRSLQLINKMLETGLMIPDGDTFGMDESEEILINHRDDPEVGEIIQLTLQRCDRLGITPDVSDELESDEEPDAEDPVEKALQEKIAELRAREQQNLVDEEAQVDEDGPLPTVEPWQGVTRRNDLAALRALTKPHNTQVVAAPPLDPSQTDDLSGDRETGEHQDLETGAEDAQTQSAVIAVSEAEQKQSGKLMSRMTGLFSRN